MHTKVIQAWLIAWVLRVLIQGQMLSNTKFILPRNYYLQIINDTIILKNNLLRRRFSGNHKRLLAHDFQEVKED